MMAVIEALSNYAAEMMLAAFTVCMGLFFARRFRQRAAIFRLAYDATASFYAQADELFKEPELPDTLKAVLYDVLLAVTKDDVGQIAFDAISYADAPPPAGSPLSEAVEELYTKHPVLAGRFFDALRSGIVSVVCSHAHSDHSISATIVKAISSVEVVKKAELVERGLVKYRPAYVMAA